jgi:multicomponent Na+:H+ antiporter subunit D
MMLALPLVIPLATAIACFLAKTPAWQRRISMAGAAGLLGTTLAILGQVRSGAVLALYVGEWPAPYGIVLVADALSGIMLGVTGLLAVATVMYGWRSIPAGHEAHGHHVLLHIMLAGVCGAFLTGDLFNLYVWFEVLLIASFVLLVLGGGREAVEGAVKYVVLNLIASALFLTSLGILYGMAGTLNMADLAGKADRPEALPAAMLLLTAFGVKAAAFPLFAVSAIFAGLLTKVGVYALLRVFTLIFTDPLIQQVLLVVAGLTMVTGVLGALAQGHFRRVLSFHIVSQIGYMVLGLALFTPLALAAAVFYIAHHIIVKANLFFVAGVAHGMQGTEKLADMGGLARHPWLAALFLIPALSLAGLPPLSGFWAKLFIVQAGLDAQAYLLVGVALAVGLLTLMSMAKIWHEAFWKPGAPEGRVPHSMVAPVVALALLTVLIGLLVAPLLDIALVAGQQLMRPDAYIAMGGGA